LTEIRSTQPYERNVGAAIGITVISLAALLVLMGLAVSSNLASGAR
jgi:hypothetical protein